MKDYFCSIYYNAVNEAIRVDDLIKYNELQAHISREYLKKHNVYRYRTVKTDDMDDSKIINVCHWYCEENNLVQDFTAFLEREINLQNAKEYLGKTINVIIDRPLGSHHPKHNEVVYPVNYGFFEDVIAPDGEPQDVYVLGVYEPVSCFEGRVIAVIHRLDDVEDKWVVAPDELRFTKEDIIEATRFQEQFFNIEIIM